MKKGYRTGRLGEEIRRIISELLLRELKDPRLTGAMVSITSVDVSGDGGYATVYLTVFDNSQDEDKIKEDVLTAMEGAKGVMKREIGRQIKLRHVPELRFRIDSSSEYGRHIDSLIRQTLKGDE